MESEKGFDPTVNAVCMGRIQRCHEGRWENAVLLLAEAGVSDVIAAVDMRGREVKYIYNYERTEWSGCFIVQGEKS